MFRKKAPQPSLPPEWMIVGLGNPGPEYKGTRHNVGFDLVERMAARHDIKIASGKHRAMIGTGMMDGRGVALVKPLTFMNLSGQSVAPLMKSFGLKPDRLLVIADEMDLPLGALRLREAGGPAGHNGHRSIIQSLGTNEYPRLRIGIGANKDETIDHVLGKFKPNERDVIDDALDTCVKAIETMLESGIPAAQELLALYNKRGG